MALDAIRGRLHPDPAIAYNVRYVLIIGLGALLVAVLMAILAVGVLLGAVEPMDAPATVVVVLLFIGAATSCYLGVGSLCAIHSGVWVGGSPPRAITQTRSRRPARSSLRREHAPQYDEASNEGNHEEKAPKRLATEQ